MAQRKYDAEFKTSACPKKLHGASLPLSMFRL